MLSDDNLQALGARILSDLKIFDLSSLFRALIYIGGYFATPSLKSWYSVMLLMSPKSFLSVLYPAKDLLSISTEFFLPPTIPAVKYLKTIESSSSE